MHTPTAQPPAFTSTTSPWKFYPGQLDYLSRVGCKDFALIAADVGTGKTLMSTALIRLKLERLTEDGATFDGRALIVAPQGTVRADAESAPDTGAGDIEGDDTVEDSLAISQWRAELRRFAPGIPVYELFNWDQYMALVKRYGQLPPGIYLSYFEAMFRNGAREFLPPKWTHYDLCRSMGVPPGPGTLVFKGSFKPPYGKKQTLVFSQADVIDYGHDPLGIEVGDTVEGYEIDRIDRKPDVDFAAGVGAIDPEGKGHGIQCLVAPCLSTMIEADHSRRSAAADRRLGIEPTGRCTWDLVALDEAHVVCSLDAQLTRSFIKLQPKYRYLLTATPIPNIVTNMFSLMGWLCVPDWYRGERRNAAWPYARDEIGRFNNTFLCIERDYTQEDINKAKNKRWAGKCTKVSPVLSSPARLLKLIKRNMAFISKEACNPAVVPCKVIDIRVPLGEEQGELYEFFANRANIPGKNAWRKAGMQLTMLRNTCAAPRAFSKEIGKTIAGAPLCRSNYNPKTVAVLKIIHECLGRGEQVVVVANRTEQTDEYYFRLASAIGAERIARIDSTVLAADHAAQAARFKEGLARVLFMGMRCAKAYSFDTCPNMIIASLEYSCGTLHQAKGRIWRVNSRGSKLPPKTAFAAVADETEGADLFHRPSCRVWCVLTSGTIEETVFDVVATKQDAATICLLGRRVPREFKPIDMEEVLAQSLENARLGNFKSEGECESTWQELRAALADTQKVPAWVLRRMASRG